MAYKVPGIKIKEKRIFGRNVPTNDTAVPVFIGYTQKASAEVVRINSLKEYVEKFGGGFYPIPEAGEDDKSIDTAATDGNKPPNRVFFLYESIKLFYTNGGSTCYVVSVGEFDKGKVKKEDLLAGLNKMVEVQQGNLVLVPDAVSLGNEKGDFYNHLLGKCNSIKDEDSFINQFAILDADIDTAKFKDEVSLKELTSGESLVYGAMYHPWLQTTIVSEADIETSLLSDGEIEKTYKNLKGEDLPLPDELENSTIKERANFLRRDLELGKKWEALVSEHINSSQLLPPSGAVAGAFVRSDTRFGIQKAPANIVLQGVTGLNQVVTDAIQKEFNAPENGKSINCIRSFVNNGIKIWGARTLDCNDMDYRYVNVRRTMGMLQGSIKSLLENYVFEDNTERTWLKIRAALNKFLKSMLARGILNGNTPSEAFDFAVGFGQTMTEDDINNGIIRVEVRVALIRPAEFIEIIFEQKSMEGASTEEVATV